MAVGCTHGDLIHPSIRKQVLAFKKDFSPEIRFELGDVVDTAAFRSGARGTPSEGRAVAPDFSAAERWIQDYEPTHITWGNHDHRLVELSDSPNAILAHAAASLWETLQRAARQIGAKTRPYDLDHNWFELGGHFWGHGFWYNEASVRDHAEFLGGPVVMAHLHVPQEVRGRTRIPTTSYCVGTLGDIEKFTYARRRRATSRWGHGVVFGEVCQNAARLWLASASKGGRLYFPPS